MKKMILWATLALMTMTSAGASTLNNNESVITKEFNLSGFYGLKNNHAVTVYYTQGDSYSIKAEGTEEQFKQLILEVSDGMLVISHKKQKESSNNNKTMTFYITSPDMNRIDNKGVMTFETECLKTNDFSLQSNGVLRMNPKLVSCSNATCDLTGVTNLNFQFDAKSLNFKSKGVTNGEMKVKADNLDISSSGVDNIEFDFKGKEVKIKKSGTGTISLEVDCQHLEATNSGVGKIVVSGTADSTSIQNSGVTKIDVSKLNKF